MNKTNLITGETYTLAELFSGNRKIIIPDLQRDYCWGTTSPNGSDGPTLVDGFLDTILGQFADPRNRHRKLNIGLLYGYETPADFVQLCDGQQRVTTLYLLMGMLNRWSGENRFISDLISRSRFADENSNAYLQYAIRDSSLYFLNDLVDRFFTSTANPGLTVDGIETSPWYYGEYDTDPSVQSILEALRSIEAREDDIKTDLDEFHEFLTERLTFIYYDMGNRANGEETYVIINTTGEPLTATENLKPQVLNASAGDPHRWEEIETWFWRRRDKKAFDTADEAFAEFLRWVAILDAFDGTISGKLTVKEFEAMLPKEAAVKLPVDSNTFDAIDRTFDAFVWVFENVLMPHGRIWPDGRLGRRLEGHEVFRLLPVIRHRVSHPDADLIASGRLYEFLGNLIRRNDIGKAVTNVMRPAIMIGDKCPDIVDILDPACVDIRQISEMILTKEELVKLRLLKESADRPRLEGVMRRLQEKTVDADASLFCGEILTVLKWSGVAENLPGRDGEWLSDDISGFDLDRFDEYAALIDDAFKTGSDSTANDTLRRTLLAWGLPDYPIGNSYGWGYGADKPSDQRWAGVIERNSQSFKSFLDDSNRGCVLDDYLTKYPVEQYPITRDKVGTVRVDFFNRHIVRYPELLAYADRKNVLMGKMLYKQQWAKGVPAAIAFILCRLDFGQSILVANTSAPQECGGWCEVSWPAYNLIRVTPHAEAHTNISKIEVSAVNDGESLQVVVEKEGGRNNRLVFGVEYGVNALVSRLLRGPVSSL